MKASKPIGEREREGRRARENPIRIQNTTDLKEVR